MLAELEPLATTWGAYAFAVVLGLLWGSFANVCIYRWPPTPEHPRGRSVVAPGSHCFACKTPIRWYDNVPLLSWLWLRGRCRACKAPFSARYLLVEAVVGALFGVAWWMTMTAGALLEPFDHRLVRFAVYAAFCFVMVVIAVIDIDTKLILDKIAVPSIGVFYGLGFLVGHAWWHGLVGAAVGYGVPWVIGEIYFITAEREGLGLGDSTLLAVVGALLGWQGVVASLFIGALVGSVVGVAVLVRAPATPAQGAAAAAPSRAGAVVSIGAVAATIVAAVAGLRGSYPIAAVGCVAAIACLVVSRRLEPALEEPAEELPHDEPAPARTPALLAASAAVVLVGALAATVLRVPVLAGALAAGGLALVFVARYLHQRGAPDAPADAAPEADAPAPSLMRTELPFGPFLAIGAVFYLFAEPWIVVRVSLL